MSLPSGVSLKGLRGVVPCIVDGLSREGRDLQSLFLHPIPKDDPRGERHPETDRRNRVKMNKAMSSSFEAA